MDYIHRPSKYSLRCALSVDLLWYDIKLEDIHFIITQA